MRYLLNIILIFIFCPLPGFAQYYIKGDVADEAGKLLPNVRIVLKSTGYLYFSGSEGGFGIVTQATHDTLTFSLSGYETQRIPSGGTSLLHVRLKKLVQDKPVRKNCRLASLTQNLSREEQQSWGTGNETYSNLITNSFVNAAVHPGTGLSLNIDRASYSNIRRFINNKTLVPPDAVRIEEMLNYFNLAYQVPDSGKDFKMTAALTSCPWNPEAQLLFTQVFSRKLNLDSLPPSHLVFLIDVSSSMDAPNRLPLLKNGFKLLTNNLRDKDSVSIVVYGGITGLLLPTTSGGDRKRILAVIDSLQASGATPGESGIRIAYNIARRHFIRGGNNRIILATDGDFNVGLRKDEDLEKLVEAQQRQGIYLTCLGVGMGNYKDSKIQALAQKGAGNFAYLDSYAEAEKVLLKEFMQTVYTVADDACLNVKFDPALVKEYKLLGFDNKMDALKDTAARMEGGEIGSGYSAMAAFEIITRKKPLAGDTLRPARFKLSYKQPNSTAACTLSEEPLLTFTLFEKTDRCYRFASSVILAGSLLRGSKDVKEMNWNDVIAIAAAAEEGSALQQEFINLAQEAKKLYRKGRR